MKSFLTQFSFFCLINSFLFCAPFDGHLTQASIDALYQNYKDGDTPPSINLRDTEVDLQETIQLIHPITITGGGPSQTKIVAPPNKPAFSITSAGVVIQDCTIEAEGASAGASSSSGPLIQVQLNQALHENMPTLSNIHVIYSETGVEVTGSYKMDRVDFFNSYHTDGSLAIKVDDVKGSLQVNNCTFDNLSQNTHQYTACDITVSSASATIDVTGENNAFSWSNDYCQNGIQIHVSPTGNAKDQLLEISLFIENMQNIQAKQYPIAIFLPDEEGLKNFTHFFINGNTYKPTYSFHTDAWIYFLDKHSQPLQTFLDKEQEASNNEKIFHIQPLSELFQQAPSRAKSPDGQYYQGEYYDTYSLTKPTTKVISLYNLPPNKSSAPSSPANTQITATSGITHKQESFPSHHIIERQITNNPDNHPKASVIVEHSDGTSVSLSPRKSHDLPLGHSTASATIPLQNKTRRKRAVLKKVEIDNSEPHIIRYQP